MGSNLQNGVSEVLSIFSSKGIVQFLFLANNLNAKELLCQENQEQWLVQHYLYL